MEINDCKVNWFLLLFCYLISYVVLTRFKTLNKSLLLYIGNLSTCKVYVPTHLPDF